MDPIVPNSVHITARSRLIKAGQQNSPERRPATYIADVRPPVASPSPTVITQPAGQISVPEAPPIVEPTLVNTTQITSPSIDKHKSRHLQALIVCMAVFIFGLGLAVSWQAFSTNHYAQAQVTALINRSNDDENPTVPSESKPTNSNYEVAPNLPKYLRISKIGVDARVKPLGVNSANEIKAPANIYDAGWYEASAHPGDAASNGAVLIDGHIRGPKLPGVFNKLTELSNGDTVQIIRGDNKAFNYKVIKTQSYDAANFDTAIALTPVQPGVSGLNLITCSGSYDRANNEYTKRTVVFAVQI